MTEVRLPDGQLPAGLEGWGPALRALVPEIAQALVPMVDGLQSLLARQDAARSGHGPPDGWAGLTTGGDPHRLLVSEWLLADELPEEFLRRAADHELLHLAPAVARPVPVGRVGVLVDGGPAQLGAARLAQLAAIVLLHRRAVERGASFVLGILGEEPSAWVQGDFRRLFTAWRDGRRLRPVEPEEVAARDIAGAADEMWLLTGPDLARAVQGRAHVLELSESTWATSGVASLRAGLAGAAVELPLPGPEVALRALRGAALTNAPHRTAETGAHSLGCPSFHGKDARLLLRGDRPDRLLAVTVAEKAAETGRLRSHEFAGPVLGAACLNRRIVAVVRHPDDVLRISCIGKPLTALLDVEIPVAALDLDEEQLDRCARSLPPVHYAAGSLLWRVGDDWWVLSPTGALRTRYRVVAPGRRLDTPRLVFPAGRGLVVDGRRTALSSGAEVVLGPEDWFAARDGDEWQLFRGDAPSERLAVPADSRAVALVPTAATPALATVSAAGQLVRLTTSKGTTTLTRWSGGTAVVFHPTKPLVAVQRSSTIVELGDHVTGRTLRVLEADRS